MEDKDKKATPNPEGNEAGVECTAGEIGSGELGSVEPGSKDLVSSELASVDLGSKDLVSSELASVDLGSVGELGSSEHRSGDLGTTALGELDAALEKLGADDLEFGEAGVSEAGEIDSVDIGSVLSSIQSKEAIAAMRSRLNRLVGHTSGYIENLPKVVKRRIKALKKIQWESSKLEAQFYQEVHILECKYSALYSPLFEKRCQFIMGKIEPTDEECDFPSDYETEDEELVGESTKKVPVNEHAVEKQDDDVKGIPEFWLTTFKNVAMLSDMIQDHDEPILRHLKNITVKLHKEDPMGFTLEFHFDSNDYFTNSVLTKEYEMRCEPEEKDPFSFDGPEIIKCKGCSIDWKKGKNVTVKTIKKKQKHKSRGSVRTVLRTVQNDSFFNFFNPPAIPAPDETVDSDTEALLSADFEIGHFLKDRVIPRAVLYFTGEALTDFEDDEDEEEDEEVGNEDDDEDDPDFKVDKKYKKQTPPPECKQQ